jgi:hypothetical protein
MTEKRLEYSEELWVTSLKAANNFEVNLLETKNASTMVTSTFFVDPKAWHDPLSETLSRVSKISYSIRLNLGDKIPFKGRSLVTTQNSEFWGVTKIH